MDENDDIIGSPAGVGAQLRGAREAKGLSLEQLAAETRIPQRHLIAMEAGDFAKLPGRTYAVGFARTYAKTVGLDQDDIAAGVRDELDVQSEEGHRPASFEPGDPARVPSRALGWFAAFAVLLLLAGGFFFFRTIFAPAEMLTVVNSGTLTSCVSFASYAPTVPCVNVTSFPFTAAMRASS